MAAIPIPTEKIAEYCRRHHIRKLALFGSVLTGEFTPESDVDVLVEYEPGKMPGFGFFTIQEELSQFFQGHPVDLGTFRSLNWRIRPEVLQEAQVIYAQEG